VTLLWDESARKDCARWPMEDRTILKRMNNPVRDLRRNGNEGTGNEGTGKPEAVVGATVGGPAYTRAGAKSSRAGARASTERHAAASISTARRVSSRG